MDRLLFVLRDPLELRDAARSEALTAAEGADRAICLVRGDGDPSGMTHLGLQQRLTVEMRACLGAAAESMPTFVVSGQAGDDVESCASGWGATRVIDLGRLGRRG